MKQFITDEQYNELTLCQKVAFYNRMFVLHKTNNDDVETRTYITQNRPPNIGELIEFLGFFLISIEIICPDKDMLGYRIKTRNKDFLFLEDELINGLWEAAKLKFFVEQI